ncbi:hypothetical protein OAU93_01175 [bacterium]|nr:hypothetical protein [bacterium]
MIELTCKDCKSVLKVDSVHAGLKARCPQCQCLNLIPSADDSFDVEGGLGADAISDDLSVGHANGVFDSIEENEAENPYRAVPANPYNQPTAPRGGPSQAGLIFGITSVALTFFGSFFCCLFPLFGMVLGIVGLIVSLNANSEYRTLAIVLNSISIASILLFILGIAAFMFLSVGGIGI